MFIKSRCKEEEQWWVGHLDLIVDKDDWLTKENVQYRKGVCLVRCKKHEVCVEDSKSKTAVCLGKHSLKEGRKLIKNFDDYHLQNKHKKIKPINVDFHKKARKHRKQMEADLLVLPDNQQGFRKNVQLPRPYDSKDFDEDSKHTLPERPHVDISIHAEHAKAKESIIQLESAMETITSERNASTNTAVDCQPEDLREMRKRLTGWYSLLHTQNREKKHGNRQGRRQMKSGRKQFRKHLGKALTKHHEKHGSCDCVKSVMWEMRHLDENRDHQLSQHELKQVEQNSREPCIQAFLQSCDANIDGVLSKHEWCCCFSDVIPPCYEAVRNSKAKPAGFVPLCTEDGYYQHTQCERHTGECWCVDLNGNEVNGTRTHEHPHCGKLDSMGKKKIQKNA
ncbi:hypothetical protein ScPMuIL_004059 [Solemya velum]